MSDAASEDRSRLLRALALSQRFHLFLANVESPRAADQLVRQIEDELPRTRGRPVELVRLDPYEGRESLAPLEGRELDEQVLIPLLAPPEERRARDVMHVVDASRATPADEDAWVRFFALWNEKRNALQKLGGEVLVLLPEDLSRLFKDAAPDVWSIRSGEYALEEIPVHAGPEALGWYRAISPLALFGGDLLVMPWLTGLLLPPDADEITAEPLRRGATSDTLIAQREVRRGEEALTERCFGEAESKLRPIVDKGKSYPDPEIHERAAAVLAVALAAEDRADEALALLGSGDGRSRTLKAAGYAHWCAGHLSVASSTCAKQERIERVSPEAQARVLRYIERGEIDMANRWTAPLAADADERRTNRITGADACFLTSDFRMAARLLDLSHDVRWWDALVGDAMRFDTLAALVALARGDRARAANLLRRCWRPMTEDTAEPEMRDRVRAFYAFASGLLLADGQDPKGAAMWFGRARHLIEQWSWTGFDRRSLHRASLAVDLAHATVDPAPTNHVGVARKLVARADDLLGPTAEDFIARVLAVEARRELARRLADRGDDEAAAETHRALDLARPLAGRGVPAWDAIVAATEREAFTLPAR